MSRLLYPLFTALLFAILLGWAGAAPQARGQGQPALAPNRAAQYYESGLARARKGEADLARDDYQRAIELDPDGFE